MRLLASTSIAPFVTLSAALAATCASPASADIIIRTAQRSVSATATISGVGTVSDDNYTEGLLEWGIGATATIGQPAIPTEPHAYAHVSNTLEQHYPNGGFWNGMLLSHTARDGAPTPMPHAFSVSNTLIEFELDTPGTIAFGWNLQLTTGGGGTMYSNLVLSGPSGVLASEFAFESDTSGHTGGSHFTLPAGIYTIDMTVEGHIWGYSNGPLQNGALIKTEVAVLWIVPGPPTACLLAIAGITLPRGQRRRR